MLNFQQQEIVFGQIVVRARFDAKFREELLNSPMKVLEDHGVDPDAVTLMSIPDFGLPSGTDMPYSVPLSPMVGTDIDDEMPDNVFSRDEAF